MELTALRNGVYFDAIKEVVSCGIDVLSRAIGLCECGLFTRQEPT